MANICALLLPLFLLFSASSSSRVSSSSPSQYDGFSSVIGQAERLIRDLNLVPKFANTLSRYRSDVSSSSSPRSALVEERIRLYVEGESESSISREELGHHAGYFNLPNTHDSRFNLMSLDVFYFCELLQKFCSFEVLRSYLCGFFFWVQPSNVVLFICWSDVLLFLFWFNSEMICFMYSPDAWCLLHLCLWIDAVLISFCRCCIWALTILHMYVCIEVLLWKSRKDH